MYKLTASDDGAIMNQVQATHAPHGRQIVVDPLIDITDQILVQAIACSTGDVHVCSFLFFNVCFFGCR
ncbi:hypothetical protein L6164_033191 [Bauhinia variegata]|uniref:Uncharacterized protein n=1 Tax=Bauhinia variegata TaxID=167791 RepID=A0ACB9KRC5_BAUVA|nr:hypothetical protein L6164_033191 [Bauhinia variegata]